MAAGERSVSGGGLSGPAARCHRAGPGPGPGPGLGLAREEEEQKQEGGGGGSGGIAGGGGELQARGLGLVKQERAAEEELPPPQKEEEEDDDDAGEEAAEVEVELEMEEPVVRDRPQVQQSGRFAADQTKLKAKEHSRQVREMIIAKYRSGEGYKTISKALNIPRSSVQSIVKKWKRYETTATLPRSGRPCKPGRQRRTPPARGTAAGTLSELQTPAPATGVEVHGSTV